MDDYLEFQPPEGAGAANGDEALVGVSQHVSNIFFQHLASKPTAWYLPLSLLRGKTILQL